MKVGNDHGPDSVMVRASASGAGGTGSNPGRVIPKTLKMVLVATLLGAQHSLGKHWLLFSQKDNFNDENTVNMLR